MSNDSAMRTARSSTDDSFLAELVESSDDAIYAKDSNVRVTRWNRAAERLYGYSADEIIGQPLSILVPEDRRGEEVEILNKILDGQHVEHYETVRIRKDGSAVEVSVSVSPVRDASGEIVEAAAIARDISERKRAEQLQRKQALELNDEVVQGLAAAKLALEMGDVGRGLDAVTETLGAAKEIVARLLENVKPGDLVRQEQRQRTETNGA